ncbi:FtsK/SpoIIIE family DNA translocase [Pseudofulvibacter geojedonensis]|uniref:DNA translocase FtsK 4TM domain-containing protein n=1 Tax=Pseudofulvibacter geojedonensis TaxID=1123758 RepID=A0ABW3I1Y2_9FLAO
MAKKKSTKTKKKSLPKFKIPSFTLSKQQETILGSFLFLLGVLLLISFISFLFTWKEDISEINNLSRNAEYKNLISGIGAKIAYFFIYKGLGIASITFAVLTSLSGIHLLLNANKEALKKRWIWGTLVAIWLSTFLGFFGSSASLLGGVIGFELNDFLQDYLGKIGTVILLLFLLITYLVLRFKFTLDTVLSFFNKTAHEVKEDFNSEEINSETVETPSTETKTIDEEEAIIANFVEENTEQPQTEEIQLSTTETSIDTPKTPEEITIPSESEGDLSMKVEVSQEEKTVTDNLSDKLVEDFGEFDPTLELSNFKFPTIDLLKDYTSGQGITINQEELEENKNQIVTTLKNYKIEIANIKATVGPTVTLYEIVPEAGVRISKIKNLEDDIALSLAALGIRIIAPMPGKGTIGIEVPNKNPRIVSMRAAISSKKFQEAEMQLPIAFGKTISNETMVVDLAKMPHLLMAGATGQGKSVGLNCILTSLLYKKHPAEVKFVLVDPKKVELTLFNKIERHYLAKLPDSEEAIITDNSKVINTLNSLCIEMDNRYELLKNAFCRNIVEYNKKFKARKLNPNDGHKFLPYIVLVVDEFADLIMTAGKEVETPIARLAQLARAIGIHLIIATQRPSVNVITGMIKANFPARVAFRVMTGIDSKTILDQSGANQLIGRGDMLYTQGNELVRIQCAFVDTPEVEKITEFIGGQKAYPDAHLLPEYVGEEGGTTLDNNISDRDKLFREAAEVLVTAQQGSASLLQRKLKLGYNRAGRLIDQLEAAGIVGPFEGSKARQVLVPDLIALDQLLENEK